MLGSSDLHTPPLPPRVLRDSAGRGTLRCGMDLPGVGTCAGSAGFGKGGAFRSTAGAALPFLFPPSPPTTNSTPVSGAMPFTCWTFSYAAALGTAGLHACCFSAITSPTRVDMFRHALNRRLVCSGHRATRRGLALAVSSSVTRRDITRLCELTCDTAGFGLRLAWVLEPR